MPIWGEICCAEQKYMPFFGTITERDFRKKIHSIEIYTNFVYISVVVACGIVLDLRLDFLSKRHKYSYLASYFYFDGTYDFSKYTQCYTLGIDLKLWISSLGEIGHGGKSGRIRARTFMTIFFWTLWTVHFHLYSVYESLNALNQ